MKAVSFIDIVKFYFLMELKWKRLRVSSDIRFEVPTEI